MDQCRKEFGKSHESPLLDSLRQKKFLLLLDSSNINVKIKALPAKPAQGQADPHAAERQILQTSLDTCNSEIASIEEQINSVTSVISARQNSLLLPKFGQQNDVDNQHLRLQVPLFDPMLNHPTIDEFWKKLVDYGEGLNWSEIGFKKALSNLLQQEAYKLYWIMRTKSLKEILTSLEGSFHNYETVLDLQQKLDSLVRKPGQSITNFMNYVNSLLYQTSTLRPGNDTASKAVESEILRNKLINNCSENAKHCILREQKKTMKLGIHLTYEKCLQIAKEAEHEEGISISH